jgi:hypothetical protein
MSALRSALSASYISTSTLPLACSAVSVHCLFMVSPSSFFACFRVLSYDDLDLVLLSVVAVGFGSIRIEQVYLPFYCFSTFYVKEGAYLLDTGADSVFGDLCLREVFDDGLGVPVGEVGGGIGAFEVELVHDPFPGRHSYV